MATGMIFAALAFVAATLVEINVVKTVVDPAPEGKCLLQVVNLAQGDISVKIPNNDLFPDAIAYLQDPPKYEMLELEAARMELNIEVSLFGSKVVCRERFEDQKAHSLIIYKVDTNLRCMLVEDNVEKNTDGKPYVRFLSTLQEAMNITVGQVNFYAPPDYSMSSNDTVDRNEYPAVKCDLQSGDCPDLNLGLLDFGASYTFILMKESGQIVAHRMEDVKANSVHIAWQIPQYVLLTAGEVMFSITGLEFSYSQAPSNMKSVLQAGWLLTVAFGNVIVLIVAEGAGLEQWKEFVLFAGLLLGVCIIFSVMSVFYKYVEPENMDKINLEDTKEEDEGDGKKSSMMLNKTGKTTKL